MTISDLTTISLQETESCLLISTRRISMTTRTRKTANISSAALLHMFTIYIRLSTVPMTDRCHGDSSQDTPGRPLLPTTGRHRLRLALFYEPPDLQRVRKGHPDSNQHVGKLVCEAWGLARRPAWAAVLGC